MFLDSQSMLYYYNISVHFKFCNLDLINLFVKRKNHKYKFTIKKYISQLYLVFRIMDCSLKLLG